MPTVPSATRPGTDAPPGGGTRLRHRGIGQLRRWAVILLAACLVVPVAAATAPPASRAAGEVLDAALISAEDAPSDLDVVLDSTQHWLGTNDVLVSVYGTTGDSLASESRPLRIEFTAPSGATLTVVPAVEQFATYGRPLYRARVPLTELGRWGVTVTAETDRGRQSGSTSLDVLPDDGTPPLGSLVPGGDTPTIRDARSLLHHISSDPEPLTAFYTWSLDEALQQGQPTVFVLDSYAASPNPACGGVLNILHEVFIDYPGLTIIHAEPWLTAYDPDGMLQLDPPEGPPVLTDYAREWGIREPPWVFVIDRDGRLHAKFTGVIGSDELRAAMASVSPWRPAA